MYRPRMAGLAAALLAGLIGIPIVAAQPAVAAPGQVTAYGGSGAGLNYPSGPTTADGNVWFALRGGDAIGRVTPTGTFTQFTDPQGEVSGPMDTALGSADARIWFTSNGNDRVGHVDITDLFGGTVGDISTYTSAALDAPTNIESSAGELWVTHDNGIANVRPWGAINNYTHASIPGGTDDLTAGPDGNMWFTDTDDNRVGKVTPSGTITTYALPASMSGPTGIAAGPDGKLWVIGSTNGLLATVTTSGTVTVLPALPSGHLATGDITVGSDGNYWFFAAPGQFEAEALGRATPAGVVSLFPAAPHILIGSGLTNGPGGNIWFTGGFTHKVGFIEPGGTPPTGPANDAFANAQTITGNTGTLDATVIGATAEAGEPDHANDAGGSSVWYRWTAPGTGRVAIDTVGSPMDTVLGVYTGTAVNSLHTVAYDDDEVGFASQAVFPVTAGTTYRIAVDRFAGWTGSSAFRLRWRLPATIRPDVMVRTGTTGAWRGDNVHSATVTAAQTASRRIVRGQIQSMYVQIQNGANVHDSLLVTRALAGNGTVGVSYFIGQQNITADLADGGYFIEGMAPGATSIIRVQFRAGGPVRNGRSVTFTWASTRFPTVKDTARTSVTS